MKSVRKGGIFIENKELSKIKELIESSDNTILIKMLNKVLHLNIEKIKNDKNVQLSNISEYEFELLKVNSILSTKENVEMYLRMVKKSKIKESIFCYWCSIYEEELLKNTEENRTEATINKVLISELNKRKYQQSIFLEIENNRTGILETGTEVNFLDILKYIKDKENKSNQYGKLLKYFDEKSEDVLLIGIKMKRDKTHFEE